MVQRGSEVNWLKLTNKMFVPSIFCVTSVREIPVKCRIWQNAKFSTLIATYKNFHYITTILTYIIRIKLVVNRRYIK